MKANSWYYPFLAFPLPIISGIALAYSLPPHGSSYLAWAAFVPLLVASRVSRSLIAAGGGILTAVACAVVMAGHINNAFQIGNTIAIFGGMGLVFAFIAGFSSYVAKRVSVPVWIWLVPCIGVTAEYLSRFVFPVSTAISQYQQTGALRLASYTGVWAVSFALWLSSAAIVGVFLCPRKSLIPLGIVGLFILGFTFVPNHVWRSAEVLNVAAIQASCSSNIAEQMDDLQPDVRIVVLPELLLNPAENGPMYLAKANRIFIVANYLDDGRGRKPYNSSRIISPNGKTIAVFRKHHLFGKEKYIYLQGGFTPPAMCGGTAVAAPICFDTEFTDITRRYVRDGAEIIFVPNHDPEMPNCLFNYLHRAIIPFRAAENGVPIVWADAGGLSSVVDSDGNIIAQAPPRKMDYAQGRVHLRNGKTFFTYAGDYFAYVCLFVSFVLLVITVITGEARKAEEKENDIAVVSS